MAVYVVRIEICACRLETVSLDYALVSIVGRRCGSVRVEFKGQVSALISGNDAVLGPAKVEGIQLTENSVPFEQAVCRQKLRPGSGFLSVNITTDGPTRVIEITDIQDRVRCLSPCYI